MPTPHYNPTDQEMLKIIMDDLRGIRKRLDDHIDDERNSVRCVQHEISKMREEMAGHRVRVAGITSSIALVVSGIMAWLFSHMSK